jgi:hypothetical protein
MWTLFSSSQYELLSNEEMNWSTLAFWFVSVDRFGDADWLDKA